MDATSNRRLSAIMFTDIVGYTKIMSTDEAHGVRIRARHREVFEREHARYRGQILQYYGDGTLSVFDSAVDAVQCAIAIQTALQKVPVVPLRIGIHTGDIMYSEEEVIGDGVNVASRVESLAVAGNIMISASVQKYIKSHADLPTESMGIFHFKNVDNPIEIYALAQAELVIPDPKQLKGKFTKRRSNHAPFDLSHLPIWAKYAGGLLMFLLLAPLIYFPFFQPSLNASNNLIRVQDEFGNVHTRPRIASDEIKNLFIAPFKNIDGTDSLDWLAFGISNALVMDWDQDPAVFSFFSETFQQLTLNEYLQQAEANQVPILIMGEYTLQEGLYQLNLKFHQVPEGKLLHEHQCEGENLFELLDQTSVKVKQVLQVNPEHLETVKDLPLADFLTQSIDAYQLFCEGQLHGAHTNNPAGYSYWFGAVEKDPSFAWVHYRLARNHHYFQISSSLAKHHMDLAMKHRNRLPETLNANIRKLYYDIAQNKEKALQVNELMAELHPNHPVIQYEVVRAYVYLNEFEKALEIIDRTQNRINQPFWMIWLQMECFSLTDRQEEGIETLREYLQQEEGSFLSNVYMGEMFLGQEKWDSAEIYYDRALLFEPTSLPASKMLEHIHFMRDSAQFFQAELLGNLAGQYLNIGGSDFQLEFGVHYNRLTGSGINRPRNFWFPIDSHTFVNPHYSDPWTGLAYFIQNEFGQIDRVNTYEGPYGPRPYIKVDDEIKKGIQAFEEEQYLEAETLFLHSKQKHPDFYFIDRYLKHIRFRQSSQFLSVVEHSTDLLGKFQTERHAYDITAEEKHLYISSESYSKYSEPIRLYPIEKDKFILTKGIGTVIHFIRKRNKIIGFDFEHDSGEIIQAR